MNENEIITSVIFHAGIIPFFSHSFPNFFFVFFFYFMFIMFTEWNTRRGVRREREKEGERGIKDGCVCGRKELW